MGLARRSWHIARRLVGILGFLTGACLTVVVPLVYLLAKAGGAAGDDFQRGILVASMLGVGAYLVAGFGLSDVTIPSFVGSGAVRGAVIAVAVGLVWATVGIDSTRPILELPEANLRFPGATETQRQSSPAAGGFDRVASASVTWFFETGASVDEVAAFYRDSLLRSSWVGGGDFVGGEWTIRDWERDGYHFQLDLGTPPWPHRFAVRIFGRPQ